MIVRMSKRKRGKHRGLLSGPPGEPEPKNQRNQNRTRNTKRGQAVQARLWGMFGSLWHHLPGRRLKIPVRSWQAVGYFALSREGRGSQKSLRPRVLLLVQQYCGQAQRISILILQREHGCFPRIGERSIRVLFSSVGSSLSRPGRHRDLVRAN